MIKNKLQKKNRIPFIILSVFVFFRALLVFGAEKTGLSFGEFFLNPEKNITFDILTAVFSILFSYLIFCLYNSFDRNIIPLLVFIAADPKFTVFQSDFIEVITGILMLVTIIIMMKYSGKIGFVSCFIFCALSAFFLPMSLFSCMPVVCLINSMDSERKDFKIFNCFSGLLIFVIFSLVRILTFKDKQLVLDSFMFNYSDGYDFSVPVGHTFSNSDFAVYALSAVSIVLLITGLVLRNRYSEKELKKNKKNNNNVKNTQYILIGISVAITVFGEIVYYKNSVSYLILFIYWILLLKSEDNFAVNMLNKLNKAIEEHYFIFLFLLLILSSLSMIINGESELFKLIGFDFIR